MATIKQLLTGTIPNFERLAGKFTDFIRGNPLVSTTSIGAGSALVGAIVTRKVTKRKKKTTYKKGSKRRKKTSTKRKKTIRTKRKTTRKRYTPHTAGKRKDRSTKRIRMTKNGQPYVILKSGKARFIKKSSARRSRKLKGGRY